MTRPTIIRLDPDRRARRTTQRAIEAALSHATDIAQGMLTNELPARALIAARDLLADGLPATSMGEPGTSGHGDPTATAVLTNDWVTNNIRDAAQDLESAVALLAAARNKLSNVVAQTDARPEVDPPGAGTCLRCHSYVSGSATDRVRSGYCGACYQAWRRAGHPDRTEFNATHETDPA